MLSLKRTKKSPVNRSATLKGLIHRQPDEMLMKNMHNPYVNSGFAAYFAYFAPS